jgi:hypothetical protein
MNKSFKVTYRGSDGKPAIVIMVRDSVKQVLCCVQSKLWVETITEIKEVDYVDVPAWDSKQKREAR